MLTGQFQNKEYEIPQYFDIEFADWKEAESEAELEWQSFLKEPIKIKEPQYYPKEDKSTILPYAQFVCSISSSNLTEVITEEDPGRVFRACLKSGYDDSPYLDPLEPKNHLLATLQLNQEVLMKITPGTLATLTWLMKIDNKKAEKPEEA